VGDSGGHRRVVRRDLLLEAFTTGAWDTTGMLLDRFDDVRDTAKRLPYAGVS
jgi:hypothetical protein